MTDSVVNGAVVNGAVSVEQHSNNKGEKQLEQEETDHDKKKKNAWARLKRRLRSKKRKERREKKERKRKEKSSTKASTSAEAEGDSSRLFLPKSLMEEQYPGEAGDNDSDDYSGALDSMSSYSIYSNNTDADDEGPSIYDASAKAPNDSSHTNGSLSSLSSFGSDSNASSASWSVSTDDSKLLKKKKSHRRWLSVKALLGGKSKDSDEEGASSEEKESSDLLFKQREDGSDSPATPSLDFLTSSVKGTPPTASMDESYGSGTPDEMLKVDPFEDIGGYGSSDISVLIPWRHSADVEDKETGEDDEELSLSTPTPVNQVAEGEGLNEAVVDLQKMFRKKHKYDEEFMGTPTRGEGWTGLVKVMYTCEQEGGEEKGWAHVRELLEELTSAGTLEQEIRKEQRGCYPLHAALGSNAPPDIVMTILSKGEDVASKPDEDGMFPLHIACKTGAALDILEALVESNKEVANSPDLDGRLPLHFSCDIGAPIEVIKLLLNASGDHNAPAVADDTGKLPLHYAFCEEKSSDEVIKLLIETYPEGTSIADFMGKLPLHHAIDNKDISEDLIECLLSHWRDATLRPDRDGRLPLHIACVMGAKDRVLELLVNRCKEAAGITDMNRRLPIHYAACDKDCSEAAMKIIINANPEAAKTKDDVGRLPLHAALEEGCSDDVVRVLTEAHRAALTVKDEGGRMPLHIAAEKKETSEELIKLLLSSHREATKVEKAIRRQRPAIKVSDPIGRLPLHIALEKGLSEGVIKLLLEAHKDATNVKDVLKRLPLHIALSVGASMEVIDLLLKARWEATMVADGAGKLPIHVAAAVGASVKVVQALIDSYRKGVSTPDGAEGMYPLHHALSGKMELDGIKLLYFGYQEASATPDAGGKVALHHACNLDASEEIIAFLIENNPMTASIADFGGKSPLHVACEKGCSDGVVKKLMKAHAEAAKVADGGGSLPLHLACQSGSSEEVITLLLESYPDAAKTEDGEGRLPLHLALLRPGVSEHVVTLLMEANNKGASKLIKGSQLPIHIACDRGQSESVIKILIDAFPKGAGIADEDGRLALHYACKGGVSEGCLDLLLDAYPESKADNKGNLPLHLLAHYNPKPVLINLLLDRMTWDEDVCHVGGEWETILPIHIAAEFSTSFNAFQQIALAYPEGAVDLMRKPIVVNCKDVCAMDILEIRRSKISSDQMGFLNQMSDLIFALRPLKPEFATYLKEAERMERLEKEIVKSAQCTGRLSETARRSWIFFCTYFDRTDSDEHHGERVKNILEKLDQPAIDKLVSVTTSNGRIIRDGSSPQCAPIIHSFSLFTGRYALQLGTPIHKTQGSMVIRAKDVSTRETHEEAVDCLRSRGIVPNDVMKRLCEKLGLSFSIYEDIFPTLKGEQAWEEFNEFCFKQQLDANGERDVAVKFFRRLGHYRRELNIQGGLDGEMPVVPMIEAMSASTADEQDSERNNVFAQDLEKFGHRIDLTHYDLMDYQFARVMPYGDRDLDTILRHESPSEVDVRKYIREIGECLDQLHNNGIVHAELKALNVVRLAKKMRLIDVEAACQMKMPGFAEKFTYVGKKFSSGVLPPEMFVKLDRVQQESYKIYFSQEQENKELWKKLKPQLCYSHAGGHAFVVKTFKIGGDGKVLRQSDLPYGNELVEASPQMDIWSFGVLLFYLSTGDPLFPVDRHDDLAFPQLYETVYNWDKRTMEDCIQSRVDDSVAADLLQKLLQPDPRDRPRSMTEVLTHPYFHIDPFKAAI